LLPKQDFDCKIKSILAKEWLKKIVKIRENMGSVRTLSESSQPSHLLYCPSTVEDQKNDQYHVQKANFNAT